MGWVGSLGVETIPRSARTVPLTPTQMCVLLVVTVLLMPPPVDSFGVCRNSFRCFNGGQERYGQSIFGPCRCRCRRGYTGPRCQYREVLRKRSSSLNVLNDFLQARLRAEYQQQQQHELGVDEEFISADQDDLLPMVRRRRSWTRLHPRFFRR